MSFILKEYVGFIPNDKEVNKMACGSSNKKTSSKKASSKKTSSKKTVKGC